MTEREFLDQSRIFVILPEYLTIPGRQKMKLECGRAAAQVGHAASGVKLTYAYSVGSTIRTPEEIVSLVNDLILEPVTTIALRARDEKELIHVHRLITAAKYNNFVFRDTNDELYGKGVTVLTAVAYGPVMPACSVGISDYLPKWDCNE